VINSVVICKNIKLFLCKTILLLFFLLFFFQSAQAAPVKKFLNLNDGPLSSELWESVLGESANWQVTNGQLKGQLWPEPPATNYQSAITFRPQFWPVTGNYRFSFDFIPLDSADKNFAVLFDYQFNSRGKILLSMLSFHFINQRVYVETFTNNSLTHKTLCPCPLQVGESHRFDLIYQQPDFELYIDEEKFFSSNNDEDFWPDFFSPGRPLFYLTKGDHDQSAAIFTNFELDYFPQLSVSYFSQLDEDWAEETYDHSQEFFDPPLSIASSGCALTSAAMVLNYYGYDQFPDQENWPSELRGKVINPDTLNLWLKQEADGYVGAALVNWLAISRLSSLLSQDSVNNKPILEFTYADYQNSTIEEQILAGQPLIADLGGHFVVVSGVVDGGDENSDFYTIKDPASENNQLSQKQIPIQSLRLFQSSEETSDLSYWMLISPKEIDLAVTKIDQQADSEANQLEFSQLTATQSEPVFNQKETMTKNQNNLLAIKAKEKNLLANNEFWHVYYWPKPESGQYLWRFNDLDTSQLELAQLFIYQSDGQLQIFNLADYLAPELILNFSKNSLADLSINSAKKIMLHYHQLLLNNLLQLQEKQIFLGELNNVARYQKLIEKFLAFYQL
jgi:hypothetical protein